MSYSAALLLLLIVLFAQQEPSTIKAVDRVEAGRTFLDTGVEGIKRLLADAGASPLTFDQETKMRNLHDLYQRQGARLVSEREAEAETIRQKLAEQLLLAATKFLNPVQREALGALADSDANSDLPTDENELREYLRDLTSPASSDDDDDVVINGFSGGRMPNRDEIMEIRINDNAFTAEQSEQGRGRTEIRTRAGTGQFNGDAEFRFEDESLNARNAFAAFRPPYQTRDFRVNLSGPLIRNKLTTTFGFGSEVSEEGDSLLAITPNGLIADAVTRPRTERDFEVRSTVQLNPTHMLTFSYRYGRERSENNDVGGFGLPEQAFHEKGNDYNFQIQESAILTNKVNHEVRFRISKEFQQSIPSSTLPHIVVPDAFRGGGSTDSGSSTERELEFGNLMMYTGSNLSIKAGLDGNYRRERSESRDNFNGTFTFATLSEYIAGKPIQYSINQGEPLLDLTQFEGAGFLQADLRVTPRLTMGFGARYEAQTNLSDKNNLDPRFGFAYHFGGTTVLRGGTGVFHNRIGIWDFQDLMRFDGSRQRTLIIRNPSYPDPLQTGEQTVRIPNSVRVSSDSLTAPYAWNSEVSTETTLQIGLTVTGSYRFVRGVHLLRARNLNAPLDATSPVARSCRAEQTELTCVRPQPSLGNIIQLESTGLSSLQEWRLGFQQRLSFLNLRGNYSARLSYNDVPGEEPFDEPADNYALSTEWGPAEPRHSIEGSVNFRLPWNIDANTDFNWNSGEPYSLTTGRDDNRDTNTADRPAGVSRNSLWGPSFFEVDLDLSKTFRLFSPDAASSSGPVAAAGYFGRRSGIRMTISAEANNIFNAVNHDRISGVLTSPFFGRPISARDGRSVSMSLRFDF